MSRIGKKLIQIPKGVEVKIDGSNVSIKGPKGVLGREIHSTMDAILEGENLKIVPKEDISANGKFHGLTRSLLNNMVVGVSTGFTKSLKLVGVGYRAQLKGKELHLSLGYSHPVIYAIPEGLEVKVEKLTTVILSGANKEVVGQAAANIRGYRKPEPYHGKGVRYIDERIITKAGKAAGKK